MRSFVDTIDEWARNERCSSAVYCHAHRSETKGALGILGIFPRSGRSSCFQRHLMKQSRTLPVQSHRGLLVIVKKPDSKRRDCRVCQLAGVVRRPRDGEERVLCVRHQCLLAVYGRRFACEKAVYGHQRIKWVIKRSLFVASPSSHAIITLCSCASLFVARTQTRLPYHSSLKVQTSFKPAVSLCASTIAAACLARSPVLASDTSSWYRLAWKARVGPGTKRELLIML